MYLWKIKILNFFEINSIIRRPTVRNKLYNWRPTILGTVLVETIRLSGSSFTQNYDLASNSGSVNFQFLASNCVVLKSRIFRKHSGDLISYPKLTIIFLWRCWGSSAFPRMSLSCLFSNFFAIKFKTIALFRLICRSTTFSPPCPL